MPCLGGLYQIPRTSIKEEYNKILVLNSSSAAKEAPK
jgi:hypothetical protein